MKTNNTNPSGNLRISITAPAATTTRAKATIIKRWLLRTANSKLKRNTALMMPYRTRR
jgi:hypothetical protein